MQEMRKKEQASESTLLPPSSMSMYLTGARGKGISIASESSQGGAVLVDHRSISDNQC
jgi:hypothetical protein